MLSRPVVAVVGTCDTKYEAFCYIKHVINASGSCKAILIDIGIYDPPEHHHIDISRSHVLRVLPEDAPNLSSHDTALGTMTRAITAILADLYAEGTIAGVIGAGGSGNTSVCATAFRDAFPIGFPKLLVSTMASGYTAHYVGETDMTMMYSVVDIAAIALDVDIVYIAADDRRTGEAVSGRGMNECALVNFGTVEWYDVRGLHDTSVPLWV